ncbi:GNAT family N-acetyltransferase [Salinibacter sp. 10B]|uniref:GNAT family N-acetyltransferase n=1 Tax=Salinibacter sp. 10B TaxID=1923971 RepID=UPI0015E43890|nr:GNAT family N-acetyltransferase [Salinibacter sp. 10B]
MNQAKTRPLIDFLCVRRHLRRRGVARALVHRGARRLKEEAGANHRVTLCSGYLLANRESAAWHEAVGFVELPDWLVLTHRYRRLQHNLRRGLVRDVFGAKHRAESLQATLGEMKEERRSDPLAYSPSRWLDPKEEPTDEEERTGEEGTSLGSRIDGHLESHFDRLDGLGPV